MKQKHFLLSFILVAVACTFYFLSNDTEQEITGEELRAKHKQALENSPYKKTKLMSKEERKSLGLPPNAYNEELWELTMDPQTGRPMPERLFEVQDELKLQRENQRGVGGDGNNPWIDRGPNNIGGRTRGIMFDPNDVGAGNGDGTDYNRVFAGGVSGGLWVNNDILDANSSWTLVPGIGANLSVTVIISDPNNSNIFYVGTGESYTSGAATGRGIWRSTDGGVTWANVLGNVAGTPNSITNGGQVVNGIYYINDIVARDVGSTTELFASVAGALNNASSSPSQFNGLNDQGIWKSTNGTSWSRLTTVPTEGNGAPVNPNDLEIDINNNVWCTTTRNNWGFNGGMILRSTDGTNFTLVNTITNSRRTEIEPSATNANTFWIVSESSINGQANLFTTTNAFTSFSPLASEPNDADLGIPPADYTRGQAFYDLPIESDASGNLIVGGIDLFRSTDNGGSWSQISKWANNPNLNTLNVSFVHADQHAIVQRPGTTNEYLFATDGGVFYCSNINNAATSTSAIVARNKDYNTIQFYYGAIDPVDGGDGDDLTGGTQDNGTPIIQDATAGANAYSEPFGGDGAFTEIDDSGGYMIQSYPRNSHRWVNYPTVSSAFTITTPGPDAIGGGNCNTSNGGFINVAELDKNLNILYSNATFTTFVCATGAFVSTTYRIERAAEFLPGAPAQVNTMLTDASLDASPSAMKVSPYTAGSTKLFVGLRNGKLLRVDNADGSPTWTDISGGSFSGSISDIEFGQNENEIFVTFHNYGVTSIWYTSNGGSTWLNKEGNFPDIPVKCILQNPLLPNEVIIGTDLGVWATADISVGSPTWIQTYNGMSDVTVLDLDLRSADDVILASTHGRGFFTSQFTSTTLSVIENNFDENTIRVVPTISDGQFSLISNRALGTVNMEIYDLTGKQVFTDKFELNSNNREFNLNLSNGLYLVKIVNDASTITKRIIIK